MTRRALIIDAEPEVIDQTVEVVESLGHDFDTACSGREAMRRLSREDYDYVLLSVSLPANNRRGNRRPQHAENVLDWLHENRNGDSPPVIMLCNLVPSSSELTVEVMKLTQRFVEKGAAEFIQVPLPTSGSTLDRMIKAMLEHVPFQKSQVTPIPKNQSLSEDTARINCPLPPRSVDPTVLTREQHDILQALAECSQETMLLADIMAHAGYGKHATRKSIQLLLALGFVHRPHGPRKGVALTAEGEVMLQAECSDSQGASAGDL